MCYLLCVTLAAAEMYLTWIWCLLCGGHCSKSFADTNSIFVAALWDSSCSLRNGTLWDTLRLKGMPQLTKVQDHHASDQALRKILFGISSRLIEATHCKQS